MDNLKITLKQETINVVTDTKKFTQMSCGICHMSCVPCHVSPVLCNLYPVTCHMSPRHTFLS